MHYVPVLFPIEARREMGIDELKKRMRIEQYFIDPCDSSWLIEHCTSMWLVKLLTIEGTLVFKLFVATDLFVGAIVDGTIYNP